jgi:D-3-phosphoglycerate dehydrogenase
MDDKPLVIVTEQLSDEAAQWLARSCRVIKVGPDAPAFQESLNEAQGLLVRTYTAVTEALLDAAPSLRVVGRAGTGLDNIDVTACRARGIEVVYTPYANTQAVVEFVLGILCDTLRPRVTITQSVPPEQWADLRATSVARWQMNELTLGILGLGRIGKRVAEVAGTIGFKVIYNDRLDIPSEMRFGATPVPVEALFDQSDVLSIHIDGRPSNHHFINSWLIDRMKGDVLLINTSRGFVVDNVALASFLNAHDSARAHLDVHDPEPFDDQYPLLKTPHATLTPHLGSRTQCAMRNMSWVVRDIVAVLEDRPPQHPAP